MQNSTAVTRLSWRKWTCNGVLGLTALALVAGAATPASAKISCKGIFQVTKSGLLSTPYCQDREIARVARSYGWRVSDADIRNDPLKKVKACQAFGRDTRLAGACGAYSPRNFF